MRLLGSMAVLASGTLTASLLCLALGAPAALAQYTLEVPSGATADLSPGEHTYDLVRIDGTLRLSGDTRIIVTGKDHPTETAFTMTGGGGSTQKARIECSPDDSPIAASGADGTRGADGYYDPADSGSGSQGGDGTNGGNGADGIVGAPGWSLTLIIHGDAILENAEINVKGGDGGPGGAGGRGGDGGNGGGAGSGSYYVPYFGGSGGDGGNGGSGAPGGDGGHLQVLVTGSLTMRQTGWFVSGGGGGGGGWPGEWGNTGSWNCCNPRGTLPSKGEEGYGGHGEAAGKGGSIVLDVGADLIVTNPSLPAFDANSYRQNQMAAQGGWGGAGSRDYTHGSTGCQPGASADGGTITIRVKGQMLETNYPIIADGGRGANVYSAATNMVGPTGGTGGSVQCEAYGGIVSSTGQLYFGAPGGLGSGTVGSLLWTPAGSRARPGTGGNGGTVILRAPVITDHALPMIPGVPGGLGGVDSYDYTFAPSGTPGTIQSDLHPPVFVPELRVYYKGTELPNATGVVDLGSIMNGARFQVLIRNTGTAPLSLANLNVPVGYQVIDGLAPWVFTGLDSDTLTLQIPLDVSGTFSDTIQFYSNDARSQSFTFLVTGTTTRPKVGLPWLLLLLGN